MYVERSWLPGWIKVIIGFKRCLYQGKERSKKQSKDQEQNNLVVNGTHQQGIFPDDLAHTMRTNNTYLHKKQEAAKHCSFKLSENEGKKYINKTKESPPHDLRRPISIQL